MRRHAFKIKLFIFTSTLLAIFLYFYSHPKKDLISLFPIEHYDQDISQWINTRDADYDTPLLTKVMQKIRYAEWYSHYYGNYSPWNKNYIEALYAKPAPEDIKANEEEKINFYSNKNKPLNEMGYGSNFRLYTQLWIDQLKAKINLVQFTHQHYNANQRAIAIDNIAARQLPTNEVYFYSHTIAGQGYPFDNMQASVIWAGTPLYILGESLEHDWSFVLSPQFTAWVKNTDIARVDQTFVIAWESQAKKNNIAILQTQLPIKDTENNLYRFTAYIGMTFPGEEKENQIHFLIPVVDEKRQAHIHHAYLTKNQATLMPLQTTPHHFVMILNSLIGRPYGWGSMYFYNDCASELKNLFTPFAIWLPMHSGDQVKEDLHLVKTIDLSTKNVDERLAYLNQYSHKFMTIIYVGGHVILYVGSYPDPHDPKHKLIALSYQDMWGLTPKKGTDRRAVVGQSVLLPLLKQYPEDLTLASQADKKYFQLGYLDILPENVDVEKSKIDSHSLFSP